MRRQWKQGQVSWEEYRDSAWLYGDGIRRAKAQLELSLASNAKNKKKGFYRYVRQKRKVKKKHTPLDEQDCQTMDEEKPEVLNNFSASVFTGNLSSQTS